ncbi:MAG: tetraacyldisaccharide 4'-kinase [Planctomycetota bacterium]|jgi:tetraacyldisaccharide 4'-kinase
MGDARTQTEPPGPVQDASHRPWLEEVLRGKKGTLPWAARALLRIPALLTEGCVRLRNGAYSLGLLSSRHPGALVFSVGNLTVGGTGKTPAVEYLARLLSGMGRKPAVLSRGYGAKTPEGLSDEEAALSVEMKVYASPDRLRSARRALAEGADCLILDDGFQHRRIRRDLDVLLIDALDPWGGGRLLPAGLLREPLSSARRADLILLTRSDLAGEPACNAVEETLSRIGVKAEVLRARHAPYRLLGDLGGPPESLRGMAVFLFCGVGNPGGFRSTAASLGVEIVGSVRFPDHHAYAPGDVKALASEAARIGAKTLLTTSKDWGKVRDFPRGAMPLAVLDVRLELLEGVEKLKAAVAGVLEGQDSGSAGGEPEAARGEGQA